MKDLATSLAITCVVLTHTIWAEPRSPLEIFNAKDLQITTIKNPGGVLKIDPKDEKKRGPLGLFKKKSPQGATEQDKQIVVIRLKGKIVQTYITSTGNTRIGKSTPDGIWNDLRRDQCHANKTSSIYGSEMDWALMFCDSKGIHSTTENHFYELGCEASMGCTRLLRESARELYKTALGLEPGYDGTKKDYVASKQIGFRTISGKTVHQFWNDLSLEDQKAILNLAAINEAKIAAADADWRKNGDRKDDECEGECNNPNGTTSRFNH